ncbi:MAG: FAD-dependent monooxygenase [Sphingobacteriaceae bacterium]|nr:FAD-dependent monooxygenase [Sphingobacteriaceae bacterium]
MMPNIADAWEDHPLSSLAIIRCFPWTNGKAALMGDAAHATVPFFGQGMNAGFEDCSALYSLMKKHNENWTEIFKEYEVIRKPNGDAVQDLSMLNYIVMRDKVADPVFLLQQKVERRMAELYPGNYFPMYSMVSFSDIEYNVALTKGKEQDKIILDLILQNNITNDTSPENIDKFIHRSFGEKIKN